MADVKTLPGVLGVYPFLLIPIQAMAVRMMKMANNEKETIIIRTEQLCRGDK